jgi:hypothetical protein
MRRAQAYEPVRSATQHTRQWMQRAAQKPFYWLSARRGSAFTRLQRGSPLLAIYQSFRRGVDWRIGLILGEPGTIPDRDLSLEIKADGGHDREAEEKL